MTLATKLHAIRQALLILTVVLIGNLRMKAECFQVKKERLMVHADFGTITDVLMEPLVNFCMLTFVDIKEAVGMERVLQIL